MCNLNKNNILMNILKNKISFTNFLNIHSIRTSNNSFQPIKLYMITKQSFCDNAEKAKRNFPKHLEEKMNLDLFKKKNHPLNILRNRIINFYQNTKFAEENSKIKLNHKIQINEDLPKIVDLKDNFYDLLVDPKHECVSPKNTYYWDDNNVLRTHMTAHDVKLLKNGCDYFLSIGDVYRRDEIDSTHYPIFHQVDSVRVFNKKDLLNMENPYKDIIKEEDNLSENYENSDLFSKEVKENISEISKLNQNIDKDMKHCLDIVTGDLKYTLQNLNKYIKINKK